MDRKQITALADALAQPFEDGFQFSDIITVTVAGMKAVEQWQSMNAAKKKHALIEALKIVVDKTDTPWLPDSLTDPLIKMFIPTLVEALAKASKGLLGINTAAADREREARAITERDSEETARRLAELEKKNAELEERERAAEEREKEIIEKEKAAAESEGASEGVDPAAPQDAAAGE